MRLSTTFRDDNEARAWVRFYCAVRAIDPGDSVIDWGAEADAALDEYRKRHPGNGPEVSTVTISLPVDVASAPYRKAARRLYPHADVEVFRGKSRQSPEVHVAMLGPSPYDHRIDSAPWDQAEGAIVALAAKMAKSIMGLP